jgi:hypothetical protein
MDANESAAPPIRRILQLAALPLLCLALAGTARADTGPRADLPDGGDTCTPGTAEAPLRHEDPAAQACLAAMIGLYASPNPTPAGGTVSFSWSVSPETDCWDNLGNSAWGNYSFDLVVTDPFTWVVYCMGNGVESQTLDIGVDGGGGGPPPPPPPPPPPGEHNPKGWLDSVDANGIAYGWACDPDSYGAALEVRLYLDGGPGTGSFLGNPTAGLTREAAVGDACGGSRSHGFAFTLPQSVQDGQTHSLYAYAVNIEEGDNAQLSGSPKSFRLGSSPPPATCSGVVVLYELPNYGGLCWSFGAGEFSSLGSADDLASSIVVADGYAVTLFSDPGFAGATDNTGDAADASGWAGVGDDNTSSLVVHSTATYGEFDQGDYTSHTFPAAFAQAKSRAGCKQVADAVDFWSYIRNRREWYVLLTLKFCWDGRNVTRIYESEADVWTAPVPWPLSYVASWQSSFVKQQDMAGSPSALARVDASIAFCGFHYGCPRTHHPYVKIVITAKGHATCYTSYRTAAHPCWEGPV